jgi:hypothetical protein
VENELMRERMFTMRLSEQESLRLDQVADHYGLNAANLIRMLLKREADGVLWWKPWHTDVLNLLKAQRGPITARALERQIEKQPHGEHVPPDTKKALDELVTGGWARQIGDKYEAIPKSAK